MSGLASLKLPAGVVAHELADAKALASALAANVAAALSAGIAEQGIASLLVSGGKSPIALFEQLSERALDWPKVMIGLVDERWVPADSGDSNEKLVRAHLLKSNAAAARFVSMMGGEATAEAGIAAASRRYEALPRPHDVVILGMGGDGHTASWFPGAAATAAAMDPNSRHTLAVVHPLTAPHPRVTVTMPVVLASRRIVLPIQGEDKLRVLERAAHPEASVAELPVAAILRQSQVPVHVYYCA